MLVLGIETTCDETAASVVRDGREILSNIVASQADLHALYGGVFPELACRRHVDVLIPIIDQALQEANITPSELDLVAVAKGPGLIGALLIGLNSAKALSVAWNIPFIGVNHVEAHLYASIGFGGFGKFPPELPALGVVISGGHTFLVRILEIGTYELIGTTVDDAIGEAFDKVAALLGLPYPGGPSVEALAKNGDPTKFNFKPGKVKGSPWDFSFSGLKTNVLYTLKGQSCDKHAPLIIADEQKKDVAAAFQETALTDIVSKTLQAAHHFSCESIIFGGGVSNNQRLRALFAASDSTIPLYWPPPGLSLDNGVMIAGLGYHQFLKQGKGDPLDLPALPRIPLGIPLGAIPIKT